MNQRIYRVTFDTYKNRIASSWAIDVSAKNMKEARAAAEEMWYEGHKTRVHMFHIKVTRTEQIECEKFKELSWKHYSWGYHG